MNPSERNELSRVQAAIVPDGTTLCFRHHAFAYRGKARVDLIYPRLMVLPPCRVALRVEFLDGFALLLDPCVILEVVPALARVLRAFANPVRTRRMENSLDTPHRCRLVQIPEA